VSIPKFCDIAKLLADFWDKHGCDQLYPHTCNIGAGTYHPATVFGVLGDDSRSFYYVQPSQRPQDGRYGQAGNRVYQHHQFQVVLKPFPDNAQQLAYHSLRAIGIDNTHDIRFVENNWESPVLGANGIGWEVWCDGMEILQYTYFQKMGGIELTTIPIEYAYGLERIALILANQSNIMDLQWSNAQYKDVHYHAEYYNSLHTFEHLDVSRTRDRFTSYLVDCEHLLLHDNWYAAYEMLLQAVHQFNLLHGYGALGVAERADMILKLRTLTGKCCVEYQTCALSRPSR
jgi:glycyl-tRNA synthetase alpha chain